MENPSTPAQEAQPIKSALRQKNESDYILEAVSAWVTVGELAIYIFDNGTHLTIDVYKSGQEMDPRLDGITIAQPTKA